MSQVDLKVVLLGREFCGKTSLVERFLNDRFAGSNRYQNTIGAAFGSKRIAWTDDKGDEKAVIVGLWDTAGSERYEAMTRVYYRGARAAVICYDVAEPESWEKTKFWIAELHKFEEDCKVYICATKKDLLGGDNKRRRVDYHTTTDYAESVGAKLFETSSKTGENVAELFTTVARDYAEDPKNFYTELASLGDRTVSLRHLDKGSRSCCR